METATPSARGFGSQRKRLRPFAGVDGEGCGRNRAGQQHYMLIGAGNASLAIEPLFTGKPLRILEMLDWITKLPPEPLYVGFSFGYDSSQILRDLPPERLSNEIRAKPTSPGVRGELIRQGTGIYDDKPTGPGHSRYTWFEDFGVEYLPKNYLRVCRLRRIRVHNPITDKWETHQSTVPDSSRTIWETFGFFQMSFLKALEAFGIGAEHRAMIERNKDARASFVRITQEIRRYNQLECELLAELMERFREVCHANSLRPRTWNGAGKLAAAEHDKHGTITRLELLSLVDDGVLRFASDAYYGGRFEVTRIGNIPGPVYEYDIISAYPSAMRSLPCLRHGTWEPFIGKPPPRSLHVAYVVFDHPDDAPICGLPIRQEDGRLFWPRRGQGIYWSTELNAARRLGTRIRYSNGWRYVCNCECRPFDWVEHRFEQRRKLGKDARGYPIKLALNSLYGKLAQRIGQPRWSNLVWAGQITAATRARLLDAARQNPAAVVMFATDGMFTLAPFALPCGERLGQWEHTSEHVHPSLFIAQPGVYWGAKRPKTRGMPVSLFTQHRDRFEAEWRFWCHHVRDPDRPLIVAFPLPLFIGQRLALARGKPETACVWLAGCEGTCQRTKDWHCPACREVSFDWSRKRDPNPIWEGSLCANTRPADGAPDLVSVPHRSNVAWSVLDEERQRFDDQPDAVDLSPIK